MTDADVDGAHIRLLLMTFFYRYQRELVENGYVYIACPPLYKITLKGRQTKGVSNEIYFYDQEALDKYLTTLSDDSRSYTLQRFKGLGEMMPTQLWETTMNPATRLLKRVTIEDLTAADSLLTLLMGDNVQPRKEYITSNADTLALEDLDF